MSDYFYPLTWLVADELLLPFGLTADEMCGPDAYSIRGGLPDEDNA